MSAVRTAMIKEKARELGEVFSERHDAGLVDQYVQFSLGVLALGRDGGEVEVDPFPIMRTSASIAAVNVYHDRESVEVAKAGLVGDEELTAEILSSNEVLTGIPG